MYMGGYCTLVVIASCIFLNIACPGVIQRLRDRSPQSVTERQVTSARDWGTGHLSQGLGDRSPQSVTERQVTSARDWGTGHLSQGLGDRSPQSGTERQVTSARD